MLSVHFTPFNYYHICRKIKSVPWCLSIKHRKGRIEYYKQYTLDGVRHQDYIRKAQVPEILRIYDQKRRCVAAKREMDRIICSLSKQLRHEVMCQLRFFQEIDAEEGRISQFLNQKKQTLFYSTQANRLDQSPITLDGTILDSKSEAICYNLAAKAGLNPVHNIKIYTDFENVGFYRTVDLSFLVNLDSNGIPISSIKKSIGQHRIFHEHFGMLDDSIYRQKQLTKLKEYRQNGIFCGKNLIITTPHCSTSEQSILKQYVIGRLISGANALHMLRIAKKKKLEAAM